MGALLLRMLLSLSFVLFLTAIAYWFMRRRQSPGAVAPKLARRRSRATSVKPLDVEARAGLARGSSVVAVRFADRVVLIGVTDGAPAAVLAEVGAEEWDRQQELADAASTEPVRTPLDPHAVEPARPRFLDALRDATSRPA